MDLPCRRLLVAAPALLASQMTASVASAEAEEAPELVWRLASFLPASSSGWRIAALTFKQSVEAASARRFVIEIMAAPPKASAFEVLRDNEARIVLTRLDDFALREPG